MDFKKTIEETLCPSEKKKVFSKSLKIGLIIGAAIILVGYAGTFAWAKTFNNRIAPNVWVGSIKVGGEDSETAKQLLNSAVDKILVEGLQMSVDGSLKTVPLSPTGAEVGDYIIFDVDRAINTALSNHQTKISFFEPFTILYSVLHKSRLEIPVEINEEKLKEAVLATFPDSIQPATNAGFAFVNSSGVWQASVTPSTNGLTIPTDQVFSDLKKLLTTLDLQPIVTARVNEEPAVKEPTATELLTAAETAMNNTPYSLNYENQTWKINAETVALILQPTIDENNQAALTISTTAFESFLNEIATSVEQPAIDAKLVMENERITDLQVGSNGIAIDREATVAALSELINNQSEEKSVDLVVQITEPQIKMEDVNDLGIKEVLGVGYSSYKGSPTNRIKNIRNGVRLLNGMLIKPGEEFSLITALKPVTIDNGYLPELVIKGDKIEPEIGGGLCQIGTTTFRATMNSGLPITQRSNHSLVISYYFDPANGNPGTDATIYDPSPDLKFINDTGNYILFQAVMDESTSSLYFSLWGTSDGRQGSYTPPTLIRWIGVGEDQITETLDLEPGEQNCQAAHVGADATFTYTVENADGTKTETVFDSHYRSLPKICLLGVETLTEPTVGGTETTEPADGTSDETISTETPTADLPITE